MLLLLSDRLGCSCALAPPALSADEQHTLKHLDKGIEAAVFALREHGVETIESCEGGEGHAYPEPTVRFVGGKSEGYRALSVALQCGLRVAELRRVWPVLDYEPTGPYWELTFTPSDEDSKIPLCKKANNI